MSPQYLQQEPPPALPPQPLRLDRLLALQPVCAKSPDAGVRHVAESQFVPRAQRHRLG